MWSVLWHGGDLLRAIMGAVLGTLVLLEPARGQIVYPFPNPVTEALARGDHERIAVVGLGDSSEFYISYGWDDGWSYALEQRFSTFATPVLSLGDNQGNGSGAGRNCAITPTSGSTVFTRSGAPPELDMFLPPAAAVRPLNYLYLPPGSVASSFESNGFAIFFGHAVGVNSHLRFHLTRGVLGDTPGFTQCVRMFNAPNTVFATSAVLPSLSAQAGLKTETIDLPAAPRNANIEYHLGVPGGSDLVGPLLAYYIQVENLDRPTGAVFHSLYGATAQCVRDMAQALGLAGPVFLREYFDQVCLLLGKNPTVIVRIISGSNDQDEVEPSYRSGILPGNSAAAYADNLLSIVEQMREAWADGGRDPARLYFLFPVTHALAAPETPIVLQYREAARVLAGQIGNAAAVNLNLLANANEILQNGWYPQGGTDRVHLTPDGSREVARRELAALMVTPALTVPKWLDEPVDLNGDEKKDANDLVQLIRRGR